MAGHRIIRMRIGHAVLLMGLNTIIFLLLSSSQSASAAPAGLIRARTGSPQMSTPTSGWESVRVAEIIPAGATIRCGPGSSALIVSFGDHHLYLVGSGGQATVSGNGVGGRNVSAAGTLDQPSAAAAAALAGRTGGASLGRFRANSRAPQLLASNATGWIQLDQIHFHWDPSSDTEAYTFALQDTSGN